MSDIIVWKRQDDSVAITYCPEGWKGEDWRDELIARAKADAEAASRGEIVVPLGHELATAHFLRETPVAINPPIVPHCEYRNAMVWDGKQVTHHMGRAREMRRAHLRVQRKPVLDALDSEYNSADERGDAKAKASIAARRQALRDITKHPAIDKATTLDDLRAVTLPE